MKEQAKMNQTLFGLLIAAAFLGFSAVKTKAQTLPEPNFSAMEQYYEIIKWTYDDTGYLRMIVKPKEDPPHTHRGFVIRYFDADDVDLRDYNSTQIVGLGYGTPAGQSEKVEAGAPYESQVGKVKKVIVYRLRDDGSLVEPPKKENSANKKNPAQENQPSANGATEAASTGDCSFNKLTEVKASDKFSESLVKKALYERYAFEANTGGLTAPGAIGVAILDIKIAKSYANTVTNTVRGPQRKQDGAPVNATIYPFKAKYVVCKKYAKETVKTQYESDFVCFKDKTANWNCPVGGVPKITYLK